MAGRFCRILIAAALLCAGTAPSFAQEAQWIWRSGVPKDQVPVGATCLFRKSFNLGVDGQARIEIAADDVYQVYMNGRLVGSGKSSRQWTSYDVSQYLVKGKNVVAVRVTNGGGPTAALAARVLVHPQNSKWFTFNTDASWKTSTSAVPQWQSTVFNDRQWTSAQSFGALGNTTPWDRNEAVASKTEHQSSERFQIQQGFSVQRLLDDEAIGSTIAMAFNEFGNIIASKENGPLQLIYDANKDGILEAVKPICTTVTSSQGILPLNGEIFVTGFGPEGAGLYRLRDLDRNGVMEDVKLLFKFSGNPGEHGAHGLTLGPDGMIYIIVGNHANPDVEFAEASPLKNWYEGDITQRYEDPGGHARGIKAPGGTVIRTDLEGKVVELVSGGIRNAYDLVFHPDGGLFVHDSDMESDVGAAWYQPTVLLDIMEGGEYGWRSGWARWPNEYVDRLPATLETGRGSPTGATVYDHYAFPARYQGVLFLADWSEGRILTAKVAPEGGSYRVSSEVFLQGQPLNVTDLAVGPDGALYFSTGGRGTAGGVYRVVWNGEAPDRAKNLGSGISAAIRQPQLDAAWSRQAIALVKKELGDEWDDLVAGVAISNDNPPHYRIRAMDLMQLYGPEPTPELLLDLSEAANEPVRARAAHLMALELTPETESRLNELLKDENKGVRRAACEALLRAGGKPDIKQLLQLVRDDDRFVSFAARKVLEAQPLELWADQVLKSEDVKLGVLGGLSLVTADPDHDTAMIVLKKMSQLMQGQMSDTEFVNLLRTTQVALHRGKIKPAEVVPLREQLAEEFPAGNLKMNRELIRLIAFLQADSAAVRALEFLKSEAPLEDRVLVGMYLQMIPHQWTAAERFDLLKFYEQSAQAESGSSVPLYLMNVTRDFARKNLTPQEANIILAEGDRWPNAALGALYKIPTPIDRDNIKLLKELDQKISDESHYADVYKRLRTGIVALLATTDDESAQGYLRQIWRTDPERRQPVAMALAQRAEGDNWDYLVRSLHVLQGAAADDVLNKLATVDIATDDPEALRQVILIGLRALEEGEKSAPSQALLAHWTGKNFEGEPADVMSQWCQWYNTNHPDRPPAVLPKPGEDSRWDLEQLLEFVSSKDGQTGNPEAGRQAFVKAQCASCHRMGSDGQQVGPDLTNLAKRFTKREVLESILFPSHMISDQYRSKRVVTHSGRVYVGMVSDSGDGTMTVRDSKNESVTLQDADIDQILPSNSSIMPDGLLDNLSMQQISDLLAYLGIIPSVEVAAKPSETKR